MNFITGHLVDRRIDDTWYPAVIDNPGELYETWNIIYQDEACRTEDNVPEMELRSRPKIEPIIPVLSIIETRIETNQGPETILERPPRKDIIKKIFHYFTARIQSHRSQLIVCDDYLCNYVNDNPTILLNALSPNKSRYMTVHSVSNRCSQTQHQYLKYGFIKSGKCHRKMPSGSTSVPVIWDDVALRSDGRQTELNAKPQPLFFINNSCISRNLGHSRRKMRRFSFDGSEVELMVFTKGSADKPVPGMLTLRFNLFPLASRCLVTRKMSLFRCSDCKSVFYHSKEEQKADWKVHKLHCASRKTKLLVMPPVSSSSTSTTSKKSTEEELQRMELFSHVRGGSIDKVNDLLLGDEAGKRARRHSNTPHDNNNYHQHDDDDDDDDVEKRNDLKRKKAGHMHEGSSVAEVIESSFKSSIEEALKSNDLDELSRRELAAWMTKTESKIAGRTTAPMVESKDEEEGDHLLSSSSSSSSLYQPSHDDITTVSDITLAKEDISRKSLIQSHGNVGLAIDWILNHPGEVPHVPAAVAHAEDHASQAIVKNSGASEAISRDDDDEDVGIRVDSKFRKSNEKQYSITVLDDVERTLCDRPFRVSCKQSSADDLDLRFQLRPIDEATIIDNVDLPVVHVLSVCEGDTLSLIRIHRSNDESSVCSQTGRELLRANILLEYLEPYLASGNDTRSYFLYYRILTPSGRNIGESECPEAVTSSSVVASRAKTATSSDKRRENDIIYGTQTDDFSVDYQPSRDDVSTVCDITLAKEDIAKKVLIQSHGNVELAVEWILTHPEEVPFGN